MRTSHSHGQGRSLCYEHKPNKTLRQLLMGAARSRAFPLARVSIARGSLRLRTADRDGGTEKVPRRAWGCRHPLPPFLWPAGFGAHSHTLGMFFKPLLPGFKPWSAVWGQLPSSLGCGAGPPAVPSQEPAPCFDKEASLPVQKLVKQNSNLPFLQNTTRNFYSVFSNCS